MTQPRSNDTPRYHPLNKLGSIRAEQRESERRVSGRVRVEEAKTR